jgi:hypothetical protein
MPNGGFRRFRVGSGSCASISPPPLTCPPSGARLGHSHAKSCLQGSRDERPVSHTTPAPREKRITWSAARGTPSTLSRCRNHTGSKRQNMSPPRCDSGVAKGRFEHVVVHDAASLREIAKTAIPRLKEASHFLQEDSRGRLPRSSRNLAAANRKSRPTTFHRPGLC